MRMRIAPERTGSQETPLTEMASQGSRQEIHMETIARFFPSRDRTEGKTGNWLL